MSGSVVSFVGHAPGMQLKYGFISADDHLQEHPNVWTQRLSRARWGDRIPHVVRQPDGADRWVVDGQQVSMTGVATGAALMPDRGREPQRWEEVPAGAYIAAERLQAMDADGIDYSVLYPTVAGAAGETFGRLTDPALELACVRAYNDYVIEEWTAVSDRFIPQCIVPLHPVEATVAEIERAAARGHRGVICPAIPMHLRDVPHINEPEYDRIWATCQEMGLPLCLHAGFSANVQLPPYAGLTPKLAAALAAMTGPAASVFAVTNMLFSRILMRFPDLQVVFAESALGWGSFLLEYADHQFEQDRVYLEGYDLKPSEIFKRQCYLTGWYDPVAIHTKYLPADRILWATNFPAATSTWPTSQASIERNLEGLAHEQRQLILWGNAARLYRI